MSTDEPGQRADGAWRDALRDSAPRRSAPVLHDARAWRACAAGVLIVLHGLALLSAYRSRPVPRAQPDAPIQVRLLDETAPAPVQVSVPAAKAQPVRAPRTAAAMAQPTAARIITPPPADAAPVLFNVDGSVRLPADAPTPLQAGIARGRELLARGHNIIRCRRSRFDDALTPEQAAIAASRGAHMAHLVMGNPLDPLGEVGQQQAEDAAGEHAARMRRIAAQGCDG